MRMLFVSALLPSLVAAVAVQQQGFLSLSSGVKRSVGDCSCDCCLSARANHADNEKLSCVPRGGPAAPVTELGQGNCDALCLKPNDHLGESFAAIGAEVDYSRYCAAGCAPAGQIIDALCANAQEVKAAEDQLEDLPAVKLAQAAAAPAAAEETPDEEQLKAMGEEAAVSLARAAMMRAERHAREAKQSAKLAEFAYEQLQKSREAASDAAGQAALDKVIIEARQDANRAATIRGGWEAAQQTAAVHKAIVAAALYKREKNKAMALAEEWDGSGRDFQKATGQYEAYAEREVIEGNSLKAKLEKWKEENPDKPPPEELLTEMHNTEERIQEATSAANEYAEKARDSRRKAQEIRDKSGWYDQAEVAAAAHVMYSDLVPKGVMPPMMPPLP